MDIILGPKDIDGGKRKFQPRNEKGHIQYFGIRPTRR